ncbi:hypothetical protein B551_0214895 [Cupriavidus sp. HPC(L)]|uniref:hypothetical protein n=1 Tax=Cupriavidus sp. HPC(L) TaxID=1217418 RepID=UPI0003BEA933|nr:hypothetical protein [Cupriavidus sp. HPC(L)]ESJ11909.1 hypothetical protein B551_0214895 [Cupriavidus sp. HPC(L)]
MTQRIAPTNADRPADLQAPQLIEKLVHDIDERLVQAIDSADRARVMAIVRQCLTAALGSGMSPGPAANKLSISNLKPGEVIRNGLVAMSQATLYRAVEDGRFYCVTPRGKANGRMFPAWQFSAPVIELLPPILRDMKGLPSSEVHAFWVTPDESFDELTPAELLAGKPFETRPDLTAVQQQHLSQPALERQASVAAQLASRTSSGSHPIG